MIFVDIKAILTSIDSIGEPQQAISWKAFPNYLVRISFGTMKFFAIIALGLAAAVTAAPAPQLGCSKDGFFCEPCVNGKKQCVACTDGTGFRLVQDC